MKGAWLLFQHRRIVPHAGNRGDDARHYRLHWIDSDRAEEKQPCNPTFRSL